MCIPGYNRLQVNVSSATTASTDPALFLLYFLITFLKMEGFVFRNLYSKVCIQQPDLIDMTPAHKVKGCKSDKQHIRSFEQNRVFGAKLQLRLGRNFSISDLSRNYVLLLPNYAIEILVMPPYDLLCPLSIVQCLNQCWHIRKYL